MTTTQPAPSAPPAPVTPQGGSAREWRRPLRSRVSRAHLAMVLAALVAVCVNYVALRARDETVRVAVAAAELRLGQPLSAGHVTFTDVRVDAAVLDTLVQPDGLAAVEGWVATTTLEPGELLRVSDLHPPSAPQGQRAMSIPIEPEHAVAGDLRVGDRVDVIAVDGGTASYLVTDAEVLAVPTATGQGIAGSLRAFSVTVAVDDAVALELAVAIRGGQLEVVRSTGASPARVGGVADPPGATGPTAATGDAAAADAPGSTGAAGTSAAAAAGADGTPATSTEGSGP
jgi:Flp pilus assembly protein CpaB